MESKKYIFPLILTAVGLLADAITIFVFYNNITTSSPQNEISQLTIVLIYFILMYCWFTISWVLVKTALGKINEVGNRRIITKTTFGVGFFLLPLSLTMCIVTASPSYFFLHLAVWIVVYSCVRLLLVVIYPEFDKFMKKQVILDEMFNYDVSKELDFLGKWKCVHAYTSHSSDEDFKLEDFIFIYERQFVGGDGYTDLFHYNSSNNGSGLIHYSELDTYWNRNSDNKEKANI